eukprot:TRINITY_DN11650_c0_g1_i1.p1 TRINITY_DN11650_c0_g1~~TRINITY_DN11650_c0_g1_i1.p1  ORF type:complete len:149 (-),score=4.42 TRINITY_DN11650_c0_g1_i1:105-551(-)
MIYFLHKQSFIILIQKLNNNIDSNYNGQSQHQKSIIWDLDSMMNFPCSFQEYCKDALQTQMQLNQNYERKYRVIEGEIYLRFFASDRSHMLRQDGSWLAPPPQYDPIISEDGQKMNLMQFIDMNISEKFRFGQVLDQEEFMRFFGSES